MWKPFVAPLVTFHLSFFKKKTLIKSSNMKTSHDDWPSRWWKEGRTETDPAAACGRCQYPEGWTLCPLHLGGRSQTTCLLIRYLPLAWSRCERPKRNTFITYQSGSSHVEISRIVGVSDILMRNFWTSCRPLTRRADQLFCFVGLVSFCLTRGHEWTETFRHVTFRCWTRRLWLDEVVFLSAEQGDEWQLRRTDRWAAKLNQAEPTSLSPWQALIHECIRLSWTCLLQVDSL